ncbi:MAG: TonB-dependent receptor, partial [Deltaproteobacteria bacterium]|nr:TonB-dependent receptor [Deltaproteobacteria bacterium]
GQTRHVGGEFFTSLDLLQLASVSNQQLLLEGSYTFVDTQNVTDGGLFEGNDLPYAPRHLARLGLSYASQAGLAKGLKLSGEASFTGSQFADQANTVNPTADGTNGKIPSYWLMNAYASYQVPTTALTLNLKALNLFNKTYIASRAPQGIFPGAGLTVLGGLSYQWGGKEFN